MNKLFVCNQGRHRSRTAAELFSGRYAGIYSEESPVTDELISWADMVLVMEDAQRSWIGENFPKQCMAKKIVSLDIPDVYQYRQEELVQLLKKKIKGS